jgi:pimeloyl-ACP methyl ester carboxylesterase
MGKERAIPGYSSNGLPYACFGTGERSLVVFGGLAFRHEPPSGIMLRMSTGYLRGLADSYKIYVVNRKPGLPEGYSLTDMSDDYAAMIRNDVGSVSDIIGVSTGGAIAQHFAIDHPDLVGRLVLAMTGCRLNPEARKLQMEVAELARKGRRRAASALLGTAIMRRGIAKHFLKGFMWLLGPVMIPADPSDGIVEIEAEDRHDLCNRLDRIKADTLVIGGEEDFFYPVRETAMRMPNASLVLYPKLGHSALFARSRQFSEEIHNFLLGQ